MSAVSRNWFVKPTKCSAPSQVPPFGSCFYGGRARIQLLLAPPGANFSVLERIGFLCFFPLVFRSYLIRASIQMTWVGSNGRDVFNLCTFFYPPVT